MDWSGEELRTRVAALSAEWATIATIAGWETRREELQLEEQRLRANGLWVGGPRDFLGVIQRDRHEVTHSAIVAWLLDPSMRHGFGSRFLQRILDRCFPGGGFEKPEQARSQTEVTRGRGRADIVVWGAGFTLVIENKIDAGEGEDQCDYYYRAFGKEVQPLFVFLTPDGRPPYSVGEDAAEAYRTLSYAEIAADLGATLESTRATRQAEARAVAENYLETLRHQFPTAE